MFVKFSRSFITLSEFDKVNLNEEKEQSGKVLVQLKGNSCKLFIWLQNLEPEIFYNIYFIYFIDMKRYGIYITDVFINADGSSELEYKFTLEDVFKKNIVIDEFVAIAIIKNVDDEIFTPLVGYKNEAFSWNNNFIRVGHRKKYKEELKQDLAIDEHINKEILHNEMFKLAENQEVKKETIKENKNKMHKVEKDIAVKQENFKTYILDYTKKYKDENSNELNQITELLVAEEMKDTNIIKQLYKEKTLKEKVKIVLEKGKSLEPFKNQNRKVKWKEVELEELYKISELQKVLDDKNVLGAYKDDNRFILGVVNDFIGNDYYFGIPDDYNFNTKNNMYELGFLQFKPSEDEMPTQNSSGYWIMKL